MKFKKLRKIYRIVFPLYTTEEQKFENNLRLNNKIKDFSKHTNSYQITLNNDHKLIIRGHKHSDYDVFMQIFNFEEYKLILSLLNNNSSLNAGEKVFIDAGANVGYTTVYFSHFFNFDKIVSIEPSIDNIKVFNQNIEKLKNFKDITVIQKALAHTENLTFNLDTSFRDQKDWSIATLEDSKGTIEGITINEIIKANNLKNITLLKIDIEGAERFIFNKSNDLSFLNIVKILAVEIHDEYKIRDEIYSLLREYNFTLFESGELTVAINNRFI